MQVKVNLEERSYNIEIGSGIRKNISEYLEKIGKFSKIFVVTDQNVAKFHLAEFSVILDNAGLKHQNIILEAGEKTKDFSNLQNLCDQILSAKIDRKTLLIAFGGGVIGDLCGFVASILLRGIDFVQVPTTLLAAVDSSVGGKTAINSKFGKNLIGSFYQPKLVLIDIAFLRTLETRYFFDGFAEIVKYGCIYDKELFSKLENIVKEDHLRKNLRMILNFGHTIGHAIEQYYNFEKHSHGEAVSIGMIDIVNIGEKLGITKKNALIFLTSNTLEASKLFFIPSSKVSSKYGLVLIFNLPS